MLGDERRGKRNLKSEAQTGPGGVFGPRNFPSRTFSRVL
jgi:hypothetical protein